MAEVRRIDGMEYKALLSHLRKNGEQIKESIRNQTYKPMPVKRVEIPKEDGSKRKLGIPTVTDRTIQQAVAQVLTPIYEEKFHDNSYGFRPQKSAQQAVLKAVEYMNEECNWIVDIDLGIDSCGVCFIVFLELENNLILCV